MQLRHHLKHVAAASTVALALTVSGCGGIDGVELNGKVFDWMGISPASMAAKQKEPQLPDRAPLVLPPSANRLPTPGSEPSPGTELASAIVDPDERKASAAKERERLHRAYCSGEIQWKDRALKPEDVGASRSPYGPCPGLGSFTSGINKN